MVQDCWGGETLTCVPRGHAVQLRRGVFWTRRYTIADSTEQRESWRAERHVAFWWWWYSARDAWDRATRHLASEWPLIILIMVVVTLLLCVIAHDNMTAPPVDVHP